MNNVVTPIRTSPEQRYRVVVTNEARVSTHIRLLSNRTRPEVVEHVLEHFIRNGEAGDVVEVQGFGGYELKLAVDTCSQCGGLGWLHEVSGAGDVVLACGHGGVFAHEHARVKHDGDCGCAWGATAEERAKMLDAFEKAAGIAHKEETWTLRSLPGLTRPFPTDADLRAREEEDRANARTEDRDDDLPRFGDDR